MPSSALWVGLALVAVVAIGCSEGGQVVSPPKASEVSAVTEKTQAGVEILPPSPDRSVDLIAQVNEKSPSGSYAIQWLRNGEPIEGANRDSLSVGQFRRGDAISVKLSAQTSGSALLVSREVRIQNAPPRVSRVAFSPQNPSSSDAIKAVTSGWDADGDRLTFRSVWKRNGEVIPGVEGAGLPAGSVRRGDVISVVVAAFDGEIWGEERESETLSIANGSPVITSSAPARVQIDQAFYYDVKARDPDGDDLRFSLSRAPEGMKIDAKTGRIAWPVGPDSLGKHQVIIEVADGHGGVAKQAFELTIESAER